MSGSSLPTPVENQKYVTVSPIAGGFITLPDSSFVHPADPGAKRTVPSLTFLVTHPNPPPTSQYRSNHKGKPFHLMFDLGLRKSPSRYPKVLQHHVATRAPFQLEPGVAAQLQAGGLSPSVIDLVILSHVHYDHHGHPEDFPHAQFRIGHGAANVLAHGLAGTASHQHFDPRTLPADRTQEFSDPSNNNNNNSEHGWKPLGPFPAALDLFGDSSVYVIDTPGHLPGHINLLCRAQKRWILLCGDAFHDRRLLTGEKEIGMWKDAAGTRLCIHVDKEQAAESIKRLREFDRMTGDECELVAAHEEIWWERNKGKQFPGVL